MDEKSLLENSNGFLKLQSIINRFSGFQFEKREPLVKRKYYTACFGYNKFFSDLFSSGKHFKSSSGLILHDQNLNNYLKCIESIHFVDETAESIIDFIDDVAGIFRNINKYKDITKVIIDKKDFFKTNPKHGLVLELININLVYWTSEFVGPLALMKERVPIEDISKYLKNKNEESYSIIDDIVFRKAASMYDCEGLTLQVVNSTLSNGITRFYLDADLFKLGFIKLAQDLERSDFDKHFFNYAIQLANGTLDESKLENYIGKLFKKETLEIIQINYLRLKLNNYNLKVDTKKFVVTNPYTQGMIYLIEAFQEENPANRIALFKKSLAKLYHIKYFYLEAVLLYGKFLKEMANEEYKNILQGGLDFAKQYNYMYLHFQFSKELELINEEYDETKNYNLLSITGEELKNYTEKYKKVRAKTN
ncbi:MAG: hypothetical protein IAF38_08310 [Bacteroidia bacterium]|nr:hypothetical protein [Bacteroidia bacterium]